MQNGGLALVRLLRKFTDSNSFSRPCASTGAIVSITAWSLPQQALSFYVMMKTDSGGCPIFSLMEESALLMSVLCQFC